MHVLRVPFRPNKGDLKTVDLAAVVMAPSMEEFAVLLASQPDASSRRVDSLLMPILGNDVLRGWMERVRKVGVSNLWLASNLPEESICSALGALARQGVERFLTIELKSYAEMDLVDLLHFHRESHNPVTEVCDSRGNLGVRVLDHPAQATSGKGCSYCLSTESDRSSYTFRGYVKRILSATERQDLVGDALTGSCALRPLGREVREGIWIGEGASLANSVRVIGPSYIGERCVIRAGVTIGPFTSVERDCVVDCGTTVERSTVLPSTYVASGLLFQNALIDGGFLEDLNSGIIANLQPAGFAKSMPKQCEHQRFTGEAIHESSSTKSWSSGSIRPSEWREVPL